MSNTDRTDCLEEEYEELIKICNKQQTEVDRLRKLLQEGLEIVLILLLDSHSTDRMTRRRRARQRAEWLDTVEKEVK